MMNTRNKTFHWRPEAIRITNEFNAVVLPILNKAIKWGFTLDSFYYMVNSELNDMINIYATEKQEEYLEKLAEKEKELQLKDFTEQEEK